MSDRRFHEFALPDGRKRFQLGRIHATNPARNGAEDWRIGWTTDEDEDDQAHTAGEALVVAAGIAVVQFKVFGDDYIGSAILEAVEYDTLREVFQRGEILEREQERRGHVKR